MGALRRFLRVVTCGAVLAACGTPGAPPAPDLRWTPVVLPTPAGPPGRLSVRDAVACPDRWYLVGAVVAADGRTRPAAWDSSDGHTWRALAFAPLPESLYGPRNVLRSVGCAGGRVAMVGASSGGVHGNPRVSTWYLRADGVLAEAAAEFETYGGDRAVDVGRIAGGPAGFLIVGNRVSGAAVWLSRDGGAFELVETAPGLAGDATHGTVARDAAATADGRWVVVGGAAPRGSVDQRPAGWSSSDGYRWVGGTAPGDPGSNEMHRVVRVGTELVAVGLQGTTFGSWSTTGAPAGWVALGRFGRAADASAAVLSAAVAGRRVLAATAAGSEYALWISDDVGASWRPAAAPVTRHAGTGPAMALAARGTVVVLAADDGAHSGAWVGAAP